MHGVSCVSSKKMKNLNKFFENSKNIIDNLDIDKINKIITKLSKLKKGGGRLFFLGVGGSAANSSHAVNDFRKLCEIETYTPTDNVSELSARTNDDGWNSTFIEWLKISKLSKNDAIFILSVGGGDIKRNVSINLINSIKYAKNKKAQILGIVGRKNSYTYKSSNYVISLPSMPKNYLTPISESMQSLILHCIVSDERLQTIKTKW